MKTKTPSLLMRHKTLLIIVIIATFLELAVGFWSISMMQSQITSNVKVTLQSHMKQIENNFTDINNSLKQTLISQSSLFSQAQSTDDLLRIQARQTLIDNMLYISGNTSNDYSIFYFFPKTNEFLTAVHSRYIPYDCRPQLEKAISDLIHSGYHASSTSEQWTLLAVSDNYYAIQLYWYQGVWNGSCIPVDTFIQPLKNIYPDNMCFPVLFTESGKIASGNDSLKQEKLDFKKIQKINGTFWHNGMPWLAVNSSGHSSGFQLKLILKNYSQYATNMLIQTFILIVIIFFLAIIILSMSYTQKKILKPLRLFTQRLKNYDPDKPVLIEMSSKLDELCTVSQQFNNLIKEIHRLRIHAYENELEKQKIKMDYMQLQIKPHFFLNSLNIIHSMAQKDDCKGVLQLSEFTVQYLRYIFQSDAPYMKLEQELQHLKDYLSIMEIRYPDHFSYEIYVEDSVLEQHLPPLLLQTFVENSIKHGIVPGKNLELNISALLEYSEIYSRKEVTIFITDNGPGFPAANLKQWNAKKNLERNNGSHIGIANAIQRMELFYKENACLKLYNSPLGGAVVELHIPYIQGVD